MANRMVARNWAIAGCCGLLAAVLAGSDPGQAEARDGGRWQPPVASQGQEVVAGSYQCGGSIFTDDQPPEISTWSYLSATSGITQGFGGTGQRSTDVPADLDAMAGICDEHVANVRANVPAICTLGALDRERSTWGNGQGVSASFSFSCQGTRDEVMGVIGAFSRLPLQILLP